ncbi:hypothetical protein SDSG_00046 [Ruegeria phage DSS3-P1]|nr:hypothetical protein SDSG_00046 [Ruegeria phage DSS3-P1]
MSSKPKPGFMRPRANRDEMAARIQRVREMLAAGAKVKDIASELDVSRAAVYRIIQDHADLQINRATDPVSLCGTLGRLRATLEAQDRGFLNWIANNRVEGTTVAEFLVSCAVDAYHDETSETAAAA